MLAFVAYAILQSSPVSLLQSVRDRYRKLDSFSCVIEQHDVNRGFPGDFTSKLEWLKGGRFEIRVSKRSEAKTGLPDFFSDGQNVMTVLPDGRSDSSPLVAKDTRQASKWELTAGVLLSWLLSSEAGDTWFQKPGDTYFQLSEGSATDWKGYAVREVDAVANSGAWTTRFYLSADGRRLIGLEFGKDGREGSILYRDQRENPILMPSLGNFSG